MAMDAFTLTWTNMKAYANPPWSLIGRVLAHTHQQKVNLVLVASVWKIQTWYPRILGDVRGLPTDHSQEAQPNPIKSCPGNATHNSPISHVDYLRRRYKEQQFSEEATDLMLSSWREKS